MGIPEQRVMDIWVEKSLDNYDWIKLAFLDSGIPVFEMTEEKKLNHSDWEVFTFGIPPSSSAY